MGSVQRGLTRHATGTREGSAARACSPETRLGAPTLTLAPAASRASALRSATAPPPTPSTGRPRRAANSGSRRGGAEAGGMAHGRPSCRERVGKDVSNLGGDVYLKKNTKKRQHIQRKK